jgi:hypothetical protein
MKKVLKILKKRKVYNYKVFEKGSLIKYEGFIKPVGIHNPLKNKYHIGKLIIDFDKFQVDDFSLLKGISLDILYLYNIKEDLKFEIYLTKKFLF